MRRPSRQSVSCSAPALGSPHTASPTSTGSSPTNGACHWAKDFARVLQGARHRFIAPYTHSTRARWRGTIPSWARSSSTLALGPQKPNGPKRSRSGTSTSTTIDHTLPAQASPSLATRHRRHQSHGLMRLAIPRIVTELDRACAFFESLFSQAYSLPNPRCVPCRP